MNAAPSIVEAWDDFEAEQMLHILHNAGRTEALHTTCWHILTAECFPPRLGATYAAVQMLHRWPEVKTQLWEQLLPLAPALTRAQLANWTSGHYYHTCTSSELDWFMKLAASLPRQEDRRVIAIMLFTWRHYGSEEARIRQFVDSALAA